MALRRIRDSPKDQRPYWESMSVVVKRLLR